MLEYGKEYQEDVYLNFDLILDKHTKPGLFLVKPTLRVRNAQRRNFCVPCLENSLKINGLRQIILAFTFQPKIQL